LPWQDVRCLALSPERQEQKAAAIRSHVSQVRAGAGGSGSTPPLPGRVLAHFHTPFEHFREEPTTDQASQE
ncbi:MAG: hypothetical protein OSB43_20390, partial [Nocardioides sp.]|uniref:hypothetical protein n=1 Tax=Nocardioides sp. TaxID=35761 RepID=UPI002393450F